MPLVRYLFLRTPIVRKRGSYSFDECILAEYRQRYRTFPQDKLAIIKLAAHFDDKSISDQIWR